MYKQKFGRYETFDWLEDFMNDFVPRFEKRKETPGWTPRVDVRETDTAYVLEIELPGIPRDEIDISIDSGRLFISGERKSAEPEIPGGFRRAERRFGQFSRSFNVPDGVQADLIEACLADGVLTLTLTKESEPAAEKGRKININ